MEFEIRNVFGSLDMDRADIINSNTHYIHCFHFYHDLREFSMSMLSSQNTSKMEATVI